VSSSRKIFFQPAKEMWNTVTQPWKLSAEMSQKYGVNLGVMARGSHRRIRLRLSVPRRWASHRIGGYWGETDQWQSPDKQRLLAWENTPTPQFVVVELHSMQSKASTDSLHLNPGG